MYLTSINISSSTNCVLIVTFFNISSMFLMLPTLFLILPISFSILSTFLTKSLFGLSADFTLFPVPVPVLEPLSFCGEEKPLLLLLNRLPSLYGLELLLPPNLELSLLYLPLEAVLKYLGLLSDRLNPPVSSLLLSSP